MQRLERIIALCGDSTYPHEQQNYLSLSLVICLITVIKYTVFQTILFSDSDIFRQIYGSSSVPVKQSGAHTELMISLSILKY